MTASQSSAHVHLFAIFARHPTQMGWVQHSRFVCDLGHSPRSQNSDLQI
jgi:hypothetical protein